MALPEQPDGVGVGGVGVGGVGVGGVGVGDESPEIEGRGPRESTIVLVDSTTADGELSLACTSRNERQNGSKFVNTTLYVLHLIRPKPKANVREIDL